MAGLKRGKTPGGPTHLVEKLGMTCERVKPSKLGDSWFSPNAFKVQRCVFSRGGRALDGLGAYKLLIPAKSMPRLPERSMRHGG